MSKKHFKFFVIKTISLTWFFSRNIHMHVPKSAIQLKDHRICTPVEFIALLHSFSPQLLFRDPSFDIEGDLGKYLTIASVNR